MQTITVEHLRAVPAHDREALINELSDKEAMSLFYDWSFWARSLQREPEGLGKLGKFVWMYLAGRGTGKTRAFAEWVREKVQHQGYRRISLVGAAADEVRDIMIEGESGILSCSPPWFMPDYEPSKKRITWPNGAIASIFYGTEPEKARGAQSDLIWGDEVCKWQYPEETYDNLMLGLRLGRNPLCAISTTPKPIPIIKRLVKDENVIVVRESTYANINNLAHAFIQTIIKRYEGTRLGRQELEAQILDDNPNALWKRGWIDATRIRYKDMPQLTRIVIPIDPAVTSKETSDDTGIIPCAEGPAPAVDNVRNPDMKHYYVLDDFTLKGSPLDWAQRAITAYRKWSADRIIGETNNGGDLVETNLRNVDKNIPYAGVHASRGKQTRAEPISALYEQGRVHHVGMFSELEDELCEHEFLPNQPSPNRLDALVWGISYLAGIHSEILKPSAVSAGRLGL